jgi:GNAT superfamily N-acetyltransferase
VQASRRSIENFRGDYQQLADLLHRSWSENSQQSLSYSADFLKSFLNAPGALPSLMPGVYQEDQLIGFASGFTRSAEYRGQSLEFVTNSFLSVAPEYKKSGLGIVLWSKLVERARAAGCDGMVNFCVDGEPMNRMIEGCCRRLKLPVQRIFSVRYLSSLLKPGTFVPEPRPSTPSSQVPSDFLRLAAPLLSSQPLARKWTTQEAEWQCLHRQGGVLAHVAYESRRGILTGYIMPIMDRDQTKCLLVEDIFWDELQPEERQQLLQKFLAQAVSQGAQMATVPNLGYAQLGPFKKLRFFPTRRVLHCYLTLFHGDLPLETLPSMYLDVF